MSKITVFKIDDNFAVVPWNEVEVHPLLNEVYPVMFVENEMTSYWGIKKIKEYDPVLELEYSGETNYKSLLPITQKAKEISMKMYVLVNGEIGYTNSWNDVIDTWEVVGNDVESFYIGFDNYSIEFSFDGSFLYPIDRDDRENNENMYFHTIEDLVAIMRSHGREYVEFLDELDGCIPISNFNNMDDFRVFEIRDFIKKKGKKHE